MKMCRNCLHCCPGRDFVRTEFGPRVLRKPLENACLHPAVISSSPLYAATGQAPQCFHIRATGPCGVAGVLWEQKPPEPVKPPQPSLWRRLFRKCEPVA